MTIDEIIAEAGGVSQLAALAGVDHSSVSGWKRRGQIPLARARIIHEALHIPLHEIRPDVWDSAPYSKAIDRSNELLRRSMVAAQRAAEVVARQGEIVKRAKARLPKRG